MPKRFSRYNFALKAAGGSGAAGSALEKYKNYKTGATQPQYNTESWGKPGQMQQIYLSPFSAAPDTRYSAMVGTRARTAITGNTLGVSETDLHFLAAAEGAIVNPGYVPAKAVVTISGTGSTPEQSKITFVTYKKKTGTGSYTLPFGGTLANGNDRIFLNVMQAIKTKVEAVATRGVSFQPERFML